MPCVGWYPFGYIAVVVGNFERDVSHLVGEIIPEVDVDVVTLLVTLQYLSGSSVSEIYLSRGSLDSKEVDA